MSDLHLKKLGKISDVPSGWEIITAGKIGDLRKDIDAIIAEIES